MRKNSASSRCGRSPIGKRPDPTVRRAKVSAGSSWSVSMKCARRWETDGRRWQQRAMATAELVIKRHCGPQDSFSRADDTSFLMCFGALSEEEFSFRAAMIGREIRNRLIGQGEDPDNAYVRSVAAVVRFPDQRGSTCRLPSHIIEWLGQATRAARAAGQTDTDDTYRRAPRATWSRSLGMMRRRSLRGRSSSPQKSNISRDARWRSCQRRNSRPSISDGLLFGLAATQAVSGLAKGRCDTASGRDQFRYLCHTCRYRAVFRDVCQDRPEGERPPDRAAEFAARGSAEVAICRTASTAYDRSVAAWGAWSTMWRKCRDLISRTVSIPS